MEKKYGTFVAKMLYFQNFLDLIWTWTSRFKKILDYGWTSTEFQQIRTRSGSQNMTFRSSLLHSNGL